MMYHYSALYYTHSWSQEPLKQSRWSLFALPLEVWLRNFEFSLLPNAKLKNYSLDLWTILVYKAHYAVSDCGI